MAEGEDAAQAAARLEAALDRIATLSHSQPASRDPAADDMLSGADVPVAELAARLDTLIAQLRRVLSR